MDQCVAMGPNAIGLMEFDLQQCKLRVIPNKASLHFVVADLCRGKDTVTILRELNACFPHPKDDTQKLMHEYVNLNAEVVAKTVRAIEDGEVGKLAAMIEEAQENFDRLVQPNCPSELTAPRLRYIREHPLVRQHGLASKGIGSQGDGSIQILCENAEKQQQVCMLCCYCCCRCSPRAL